MKNVTVALPDDVYREARIRAAEQGTSVSALVAAYLRTLSPRSSELADATERRARLRERLAGFSAADRLSRAEVHDRAALR